MRVKLFLAAIFIIYLQGCFYGIGSEHSGDKIGGEYLLHPNPQVGDYAEYKVFHRMKQSGTVGGEIMWDGKRLVEIVSIKKGVINIQEIIEVQKIYKMEAHSKTMLPTARVDRYMETNIFTDMKGNILKYQSRKHPNLQYHTHPIAKPGEMGYTEYRPIGKAQKVTVPSGTFLTTPVSYRRDFSLTQKACITSMQTKLTIFDIRYRDNKVNFKTVINNTFITGDANSEVSKGLLFASDLVETLSYTSFFMNPLKFFSTMKNSTLKQHLLTKAIPSKKSGMEKIFNIMGNREKTFKSNFNFMYIITLTKQGRAMK